MKAHTGVFPEFLGGRGHKKQASYSQLSKGGQNGGADGPGSGEKSGLSLGAAAPAAHPTKLAHTEIAQTIGVKRVKGRCLLVRRPDKNPSQRGAPRTRTARRAGVAPGVFGGGTMAGLMGGFSTSYS